MPLYPQYFSKTSKAHAPPYSVYLGHITMLPPSGLFSTYTRNSRSRRTQSEAQKLKQIQAELAKLDSLLSADVSHLRDQIEVASLEFNEAQ